MNRLFFIIISFLFILPTSAFAQTLHALIFVNEQENGREIDRMADMKNMYSFFGNVASAIDYTYKPRTFSDINFTAKKVKESISQLSVNSGDVVVFYYSGHGYNDVTNIWPTLNLKDQDFREIEILKLLKEAAGNAKLILCIADCCNKQYTSHYDFTSSYDSFEDVNKNPIKQLFTGFKGKKTIIMSASKQGQYSWSDTRYGAMFGISLRKAITELTNHNSATWDIVMLRAKEYTLRYSDGKQTPQYNVTQSGDPFEE